MRIWKFCLTTTLAVCFAATSSLHAGPVASLDDIEVWVGQGANRTGFVIDFAGDSDADAAYAWGFRWDGDATGEDLLRALTADAGVYARIGETGAFGIPLYGLGYDANHDGAFALSDGTVFTDGIALTDASDDATAVSDGDLYAEGWFSNGFWSYAIAAGNPFAGGEWSNANVGISQATLVDGRWDALVFDVAFGGATVPQNVQAAVPEPGAFALAVVVAGGFLLRRRASYSRNS